MVSLIHFCGLDGSGKTTQATKLIDFLKQKNIDAEYIWLRSTSKLTLPVSLLFRILRISKSVTTPSGKKRGVTNLHHHKLLQKLWKKILLLDLKFVSWYKISRSLKNGKIIVLDRYIIDMLIDLVIDTGDESVIDELGPKFLKFLPSDSKILFLDINPQISLDRNQEEDHEILKFRRKLYIKISKLCDMIVIDSSKSIDEIHNEILKNCNLNNT